MVIYKADSTTYLPLCFPLQNSNHIAIELDVLLQVEMVRVLVKEVADLVGSHIGSLVCPDFEVRKAHYLLGQVGSLEKPGNS